MAVWRSVRGHGETKTERSRRTLGLPQMAVEGLRRLRDSQAGERLLAGARWQDTGLVFTTHLGAALGEGNVRKMFKRVCTAAGIGDGWTLRELRTSFVSLMSHPRRDRGNPNACEQARGGLRIVPSSPATCAIGLPVSRTSRTAPSFKSGRTSCASLPSESPSFKEDLSTLGGEHRRDGRH